MEQILFPNQIFREHVRELNGESGLRAPQPVFLQCSFSAKIQGIS